VSSKREESLKKENHHLRQANAGLITQGTYREKQLEHEVTAIKTEMN